jgi:hypothetical protein
MSLPTVEQFTKIQRDDRATFLVNNKHEVKVIYCPVSNAKVSLDLVMDLIETGSVCHRLKYYMEDQITIITWLE